MTLRARSPPSPSSPSALGCSSNPPPPPVEAGVDAEPDVKPDVFVGTGNPCSRGRCAACPGDGLHCGGRRGERAVPANFIQFPRTPSPCTQGEVRINDTGVFARGHHRRVHRTPAGR